MNAIAKKILIGSMFLVAGAVGTANAAVAYTDANGELHIVRICHTQWVQTGFYYGQGYWARACN
jgi:hypothetical protein